MVVEAFCGGDLIGKAGGEKVGAEIEAEGRWGKEGKGW